MSGPPTQSFPQASEEELAELQKLSNDYQPEAVGPLVSELLPSSAITTEYANADNAFQAKTKALPQKYSHYRTCRGDGHCGWRAVAFGYFETLLRVGDKVRFQQEEARLSSFGNILNQVGFDEMLYEDFRDDTFGLLRELANLLPTVGNGPLTRLLAAFNDVSLSMSIITYLKLLTSAYLQTHVADYQGWIQDQTVEEFCKQYVEPSMCEIENVSMSALAAVLVQPAGLALEILYLDRSVGDEVNTYYFGAPEGSLEQVERPTFRLLYRPGHYDILYKASDIPQPIIPNNTTVFRQSHAPKTFVMNNPTSLDSVAFDLPGLTIGMGTGTAFGSPFSFGSASYDPHSAPVSPMYMSSQHQSISLSAPDHSYSLPMHPAPQPPPPSNLNHDYMVPNMQHYEPLNLPVTQPAPSDPFRFNEFNFRHGYNDPNAASILACQTNIFRNSPYNPAHFNNPDFEPEQWRPETDYATEKKPARTRSHG